MQRQVVLDGTLRYLRRLSAERRRNAVALLRDFSNLLAPPSTLGQMDWTSLSEHEYSLAVKAVYRSFPTRTANAIRSHVQAVLREEHLMGRLSGEQLAGFHEAGEEAAGYRSGKNRAGACPVPDARALLAACERDSTPRGARDGALIALIWALKGGPSKIVRLPLDRDVIRLVSGENHEGLQPALDRWLRLRGNFPGPILLSIHRQGRIRPAPMTRLSVTAALRQRGREAGIGELTPSSLIAAAAASTSLFP